MEHSEVIVLGAGGVGSAAMWQLARRGVATIGLDRFEPPHEHGSSHGETRVIRLAYFEHPHYVPLLLRAYELWAQAEEESGDDLYRETGIIEVGPRDGEIIGGVRRAATRHGLALDELTEREVGERFPGFVVPDGYDAVFEHRSGFLWVERCVRAHLELAAAAGADVRTGTTVHGWRADGDGVVVDTDRGRIGADRLLVTAGSWSAGLLTDLGLPLEVLRKPMFWFEADPVYNADSGSPQFFYDTPAGQFYGFPAHDERGLKVAQHTGGEPVADPLAVDRSLLDADLGAVTRFLGDHLPGVHVDRRTGHAVCLYTSTPDGHFVVDRHPTHPQVCFAAGLSGHGFKMTNTLGQILADLALTGSTDLPIDFLSASRFSAATA